MPEWDSNPDSGERQSAVSSKALDHTAIREGPNLYDEVYKVSQSIRQMFIQYTD